MELIDLPNEWFICAIIFPRFQNGKLYEALGFSAN